MRFATNQVLRWHRYGGEVVGCKCWWLNGVLERGGKRLPFVPVLVIVAESALHVVGGSDREWEQVR